MIVVTNKLYVKDDQKEAFEKFIENRMEFIRESDCLGYSFERPSNIEMGPSDYYVLRSVWKNMDHLRFWMQSDLFESAHEKFEGSKEFYFQDNEILFHETIEDNLLCQ